MGISSGKAGILHEMLLRLTSALLPRSPDWSFSTVDWPQAKQSKTEAARLGTAGTAGTACQGKQGKEQERGDARDHRASTHDSTQL